MKHLTILLFLFLSIPLSGQDYLRTAGIRGGINPGLTYRQFLDPSLAYEGLMSFRGEGIQFTVLRQKFKPALWNFSDGFFLIYGYGCHAGFTDSHTFDVFNRHYHYETNKFSPLAGIDGFLGLEYHFPGLPVQVGLDFKPFIELSLHEFFRMNIWDAAFTLKYTF